MSEFHDPRNERPPFPPRNRQRQSLLSVAMEAIGGGLIIALIIVGLKNLLGG